MDVFHYQRIRIIVSNSRTYSFAVLRQNVHGLVFAASYDMGGVITSCRKEIEIYNKGLMHVKEIHW